MSKDGKEEVKRTNDYKSPKHANKLNRMETEMNNNILDKDDNRDEGSGSYQKDTYKSDHKSNTKPKLDSSAPQNSSEKGYIADLSKKKRKSEKEYDTKGDDLSNDKSRSENKGGSKNDSMNPNDTPNPLRDQTPSQLTAKQTSSPEEQEEPKVKEEEKKPFKIKFPMSNTDLLSQDMTKCKYLCKYEQTEVLNFPTIYYLNILERKLNGGAEEPNGTHNHGYDNDQGEYLFVNHDHINYRFEIMRKLGKGSFGVVLKCYDHL